MRDIDALDPATRAKAVALIAALNASGIAHAIIETRRTIATQRAYYAQGREPLIEVNALRQVAGLPLIGHRENENTITRTMQSRHIIGQAFDLVPLDKSGRPWWNAPIDLWTTIGELGEAIGLEWGGRWEAKVGRLGWDCPHFQNRGD